MLPKRDRRLQGFLVGTLGKSPGNLPYFLKYNKSSSFLTLESCKNVLRSACLTWSSSWVFLTSFTGSILGWSCSSAEYLKSKIELIESSGNFGFRGSVEKFVKSQFANFLGELFFRKIRQITTYNIYLDFLDRVFSRFFSILKKVVLTSM